MAEWDLMKTADSSATNCFYGKQEAPQPVSQLPLPVPNYPPPPCPLMDEDPSVHQYPLFTNWHLKDDLKTEEVHEEPLETEAPKAARSPAPPCASTAQPIPTTFYNELAAIPVKTEESLSHHVLNVYGKAFSDRFCHLCSNVSDVMHDDLVREMHMLQKHGLKTFRCSLCGIVEYEMAKIARHLSSSHAHVGPLNLHKLLSYIERPLCSCHVESSKEYFSGSATVSGEEQETQNQSMVRSTGTEGRDIGGSR